MSKRELKYVISADDTPFKKTMADVVRIAKESARQIAEINNANTEKEIKGKEKVIEATKEKGKEAKKTADIVEESAQREAKAQQKVIDKIIEMGEASQRKKVSFEITNDPDPIVNWEPQLTSIEKLKQSMKELEAQEQSLSDSFQKGAISNAEFSKSIDEIKKKQDQLQHQMAQAKEGEFVDWTKQTKEVKELMDTTGTLTEKLKQLKVTASETEIGPGLNALNAEIEQLEIDIKAATNAGKKGFDEFGFAIAQSKEAVPKLQTQLRALNDEMARMRMSGHGNTTEYDALAKKASELKKAIKDVNMEIAAGASRTGNLDNAIRSVQTLTAAYSIAQSASMLLGKDNEDLQKELMKVAAAMSLLQGLQTIQNELKRADSIFTAAQTAAQRAYAIAVGTSTGAMKLFRLALIGTGVGALVIGITMLIQHLSKLRKETDANTAAQKEFDEHMKHLPKTAGDARVEVTKMAEQIKLAKEGKIDAVKTLKVYNETLGKTMGTAKSLNAAEQLIVKNGEAYIQMMLQKAKATAVAELAAKQYAKVVEAGMKSDEEVLGITISDGLKDNNTYMESVKRRAKKKREIEVAEEEAKYSDWEKLMVENELKVTEIAKRGGFNLFGDTGTGNTGSSKETNKREAILNELDNMNTEYLRKSMTQDEQEYQSIVDKYAKIERRIKLFNATAKPKDKINVVAFGEQAIAAASDVLYRQDTKALAVELGKQRALYDEFEDYRKSTSLTMAKERYAEQLPIIEGYEKDLAKSIADLQAKEKRTGGEEERLKALLDTQQKFNDDKQKGNDAAFVRSYEAAMTHYDRLERIEADYQEKIKSLEDNAIKNGRAVSDEKLGVLKKDRDDAVQIANDEAFKKTEIYKQLAEEAIVITRAQLKDQVKIIEELLSDGSITGPLKKRLENELSSLKINLNLGTKNFNLKSLVTEKNNVQQAINKYLEINKLDAFDSLTQSAIDAHPELKDLIARLQEVAAGIIAVKKFADDGGTGVKGFLAKLKGNKGLEKFGEWAQMASGAFSDMSNALGGVDTQAGYALNTVGELVDVAADIGGAIASGNPVQIVGSIVKGISSVFSIGKRVKEMNAAARKEVADFYAQAIAGEKEYQALMDERAINSIRDNKTRLLGIRDEIALRKKQADADKKEFDQIMAKVQGQEYIKDQTYKHGTWFRKAKVTNVMGSLRGKSFEELSTLLSQGKLDGETKALVERLVELEKQGYDASQALADLAKETSEIFTGTTADSLTDSLANMFKEGKTGAQDLADFFESTMEDAAMSIFKNKVLAGMMEDFYKDFAAAAESDDELTAAEIDTLRTKWMADTERANKRWDQMQEVTGLPQSGGTGPDKAGISRAITSCTEESANKTESKTFKLNIICQH